MDTLALPLTPGPMSGTRNLTAWRFGREGARPRVYIQGGLHADEAPGMLVGFALRDRLAELDAAGAILGEIVVVPVANPIGLDQGVIGGSFGRFEATTGQNFNRHFPDAAALALAADDSFPEDDPVAALRARMAAALDGLCPVSPLAALQRALLRLAIEADIVIDMHCDAEAVTHLYCHSEQITKAEQLGACVGAGAVLHAPVQGGTSFDEACTLPWIALRAHWPDRDLPIPCFAVTLEWRGMLDTDPVLAAKDAEAVIGWLAAQGAVEAPIPTLCTPAVAATPLSAVEVVMAPSAGLFLAAVPPGSDVRAGSVLGTLRRLPDGTEITLRATIDGVLYAREQVRIVREGAELFFVAGLTPIRTGVLLSA